MSVSSLPDFPALSALKKRPSWVSWSNEYRNGRPTKLPINPANGALASVSNPQQWGSYEDALHRARVDGLDGVGLVLTRDDDLTGIDLDHCVDLSDEFNPAIEPWARAILDLNETYAEYSPSGTGIRLFALGKEAAGLRCDNAQVEIYVTGRYLTVTGHHIEGTPGELAPAPKTIAALRERVRLSQTTNEAPNVATTNGPNRPGPLLRSLSTEGGGFYRNLNATALQASALARWVPALFGSDAKYQPGTGAWRVSSKALGRPLQEDLSITPAGIRDFGEEVGLTPIDVVMNFGNAGNAKDAAFWLCDQLGVSHESLGWMSSEGTQKTRNINEDKTGTEAQHHLLLSSSEFIAGFVPPSYLVDGIIQLGNTYALTARTGAGKTAVLLYAAYCVGHGVQFHGHGVEQGDVIYLVGENPDNVRARYITMGEHFDFEPAAMPLHFVDGVIDIAEQLMKIRIEAAVLGRPIRLVIIDTLAAYFKGDDANSNAQLAEFARLKRAIAKYIPGHPAVITACHPIKNATQNNLLPMGGSAFLNEIDGNLTLWTEEGGHTTLHWQGKVRGAEFEPLTFELKPVQSNKVKDAKGRMMPSVVAEPVSDMAKELGEQRAESTENAILRIVAASPRATMRMIAERVGASKSSVARMLVKLAAGKLVRPHRGKYRITEEGKSEIGISLKDH